MGVQGHQDLTLKSMEKSLEVITKEKLILLILQRIIIKRFVVRLRTTDILLVFPLYADGLPVTMLNFLKVLEENPPKNKPKVNVIVNCGFIEPEQNNVCIDMVKLFCKQNTYDFNSVLSIGGGEAILGTPFKIFVKWRIKKLAKAIYNNTPENLSVTMPISKNMYLKASTNYWINYGKRNGITKSQMETMKIE